MVKGWEFMCTGTLRTTTARFLSAAACALLLASSGAAATMADVDRFMEKAATLLRSGSQEKKAETLNKAIGACKVALALLEKVPDISEEQRDRKGADIMSIIYWCRKMTPLDLAGRELASGSSTGGKAPPKERRGQDRTGQKPPEAPKHRGPQIDEIAFRRAKGYATKNPNDLAGILLRYEGVAASFPRSKWGKDASKQADRARAKLAAIRSGLARMTEERIRRFELDAAIEELERSISTERAADRKQELVRLKEDMGHLKVFWRHLVTTLEGLNVKLGVEFAQLGIEGKGWVKGGGEKGVSVSLGTKSAAETTMSWGEFGAPAAVRLGTRTFNLAKSDNLQQLAVAATVAGDYVTAQPLFEKLLLAAPERVVAMASYFERAQSGYTSTAEGSANIRFKEAKGLVTKRKYKDAMGLLTGLQQDLARNSSLQDLLSEIDTYRRDLKRRKKVNDRGDPLSAFERKVRKAFGGDAKVDEETGRVEVLYDFSRSDQLKDWLVVGKFGQSTWKGRWSVSGGAAKCLAGNSILMWKFPISDFDVQADVTYHDRSDQKHVYVLSCLNKQNPMGVWAQCHRGYAMLGSGSLSGWGWGWGWGGDPDFIWRPGEVATLRFTHDPAKDYRFEFSVNGNNATMGTPYSYFAGPPIVEKGSVGFSFSGGKGAVDNVLIKGTLDMEWFRQMTAKIR